MPVSGTKHLNVAKSSWLTFLMVSFFSDIRKLLSAGKNVKLALIFTFEMMSLKLSTAHLSDNVQLFLAADIFLKKLFTLGRHVSKMVGPSNLFLPLIPRQVMLTCHNRRVEGHRSAQLNVLQLQRT